MVSSITGITEKDFRNKREKGEKRKRGRKDEEEETDDDDEEDEDESNDRVTPGLSFWLAVNISTGLVAEFENKVRKKFSSAGFTFCSCKVRLLSSV